LATLVTNKSYCSCRERTR